MDGEEWFPEMTLLAAERKEFQRTKELTDRDDASRLLANWSLKRERVRFSKVRLLKVVCFDNDNSKRSSS